MCHPRPLPNEDTNLQPTTRRWRALVAAAVLALFVTTYPAPAVFADSPTNSAQAALAAAPATAAGAPASRTATFAPVTTAATVAAASVASVVHASSRPARMWAQLRHGKTIVGRASWYSGTRGYGTVAHVAMPGARYIRRGRSAPRARICAGTHCITVVVVDSCGCFAHTSQSRVADLSLSVVQRLHLNPSKGIFKIRMTLLHH